MARYKPVDPHLSKLLPVRFSEQILPGTFEYALNWLVDHEIDLSVFDTRYRNDETGASAYHSGVLLKVVLLDYARGLTASRVLNAPAAKTSSSWRYPATRRRTSRPLPGL
jgi:hypothetical protein